MRRLTFLLLLLSLATPSLLAQTFSIGGRYSNYSTDLDVGGVNVETGREGSWGLIGSFRSGGLVLNGSYDRDSGGGISIPILPIDLADYNRSRFEATVGYTVLPFMDIEGGVRLDTIEFGGILSFAEDLNLDHQAVTAGLTFHTPTIRPVGWYGTVRGYLGNADINIAGFDASESDTTGYRIETGVQIPIGTSGWEITPGVEWERIDTGDTKNLVDVNPGLTLETNRLFLMFGYTFGR